MTLDEQTSFHQARQYAARTGTSFHGQGDQWSLEADRIRLSYTNRDGFIATWDGRGRIAELSPVDLVSGLWAFEAMRTTKEKLTQQGLELLGFDPSLSVPIVCTEDDPSRHWRISPGNGSSLPIAIPHDLTPMMLEGSLQMSNGQIDISIPSTALGKVQLAHWVDWKDLGIANAEPGPDI